jgi:N-acetylmuramoyl-L-alanine amidase CwlA
MDIVKNLVNPSRYSIKCPYEMVPEFIVVHNTYNDASARNEIAYMISNSSETSFHYAIDDQQIVQGIPEDRNAWHASDGWKGIGNRKGIAVEICFSESGGERFIAAEKLAARFIAMKLKEKGWGIDRVRKHQDFSGKDCPHRTIAMGWERFVDMVRKEMEDKPAEKFPMLPLLRNGSRGASVKAMQLLLIGYGFSCGGYGADGIFGTATDSAVRGFQKDMGLAVDGYCGPDTWAQLLGVAKS